MLALAAAGWTVFLSCAPLLGPITLPDEFLRYGNRVWCIAAGEQDSSRLMDPDWARALRDQCVEAGVPFYLLQMGQNQEIPDDLLVRQFPRFEPR
jgi:protein gp37